jgi:hypothetical protein
MPPGHLSCPACRIRLRADSPAIDLLEKRCPICGATLREAASASELVGFRSLEPSALFGRELDDHRGSTADPAEFLSRRQAACARDAHDFERWSDDGGIADDDAVAARPALR